MLEVELRERTNQPCRSSYARSAAERTISAVTAPLAAFEADIARLPEALKRAGSSVLEKKGVTPTEIIRSLYRYMEATQEIPPCLDVAQSSGKSIYQSRREALRRVRGLVDLPEGYDPEGDRKARIVQKYGDLL